MRLGTLSSLVIGLSASSAAFAASSTFDTGSEGWVITDLPGNATSYLPVLGTFPVVWDPAGFISATDPTSNTIFLGAPSAYLGNQSAAAGTNLTFDLRTTHDTWTVDTVVVLAGTNGTVLVAPIAQPPVNAWTSYSLALTPANFRVTNPTGAVATAADLNGVLANVAMLAIPAEFGNGLVETTSLDNVNLVPEPTSLAAAAPLMMLLRRRKSL